MQQRDLSLALQIRRQLPRIRQLIDRGEIRDARNRAMNLMVLILSIHDWKIKAYCSKITDPVLDWAIQQTKEVSM